MSTRHGKYQFCRQPANYSWYSRRDSCSRLLTQNKRRGTPLSLKSTAGYTQRECSQPPLSGGRRAPSRVPGRIPLREEAELFLGVTEASAEPKTGAIPLGPSKMRTDIEASRFGHASMCSTTNIPLRNDTLESNDSAKTVLIRGQPKKYTDELEINGSAKTVLIRGQSVGPSGNLGIDSASAIYGLSEMEVGERHEGAKEISTFDTTNTDLLNDFVLIDDNNVSHQIYTLDKLHKIILIYLPIQRCLENC